MTALAILVTGAWKSQADGVTLTANAFESTFSELGIIYYLSAYLYLVYLRSFHILIMELNVSHF